MDAAYQMEMTHAGLTTLCQWMAKAARGLLHIGNAIRACVSVRVCLKWLSRFRHRLLHRLGILLQKK